MKFKKNYQSFGVRKYILAIFYSHVNSKISIINLGKHMKHHILPGAAGIIALTATICFTDVYREIDSYSRNSILLVSVQLDNTLANSLQDIKQAKQAYVVEIRRGNAITEVKVDAHTGQILSS